MHAQIIIVFIFETSAFLYQIYKLLQLMNLTKYTCKRIPKIKFSTPDVSIGLLNENSKLFLSPIENSILVYLTKEKLQVKILDECLFENLTWYYVDLPTTSDINCRGWVNKNNFSMLCNDIKNIPDNL